MTIRFTSAVAGFAAGAIATLGPVAELAYIAAGQATPSTNPVGGAGAGVPPVPRVMAQSGIPCILGPNGTIATNGTITFGTALPLIYPRAWVYFPAGAVVGGLVGWYYVIMSSTTVGVVYTAYQATMTLPFAMLPAAQMTVAVGSNSAYTQSTSSVTMASVSVPSNTMGENGELSFDGLFSYNNSAGAKVAGCSFGGSTVLTVSGTTTLSVNITKSVQNRATNQQVIRVSVDAGTSSSVAPTLLAIDTTADVTAAFTGSIAVATDYLVLENFNISVAPAL